MSWNPIKLSQQVKEGSHVRTKIMGVHHEYIIQSIGYKRNWIKLKHVATRKISNMSIVKMIYDVYEIDE